MKTNKLEIVYSNSNYTYFVKDLDEAYKIVSNIINDPNINENELNDMAVLYNGRDDLIEMVE